ncbi:MAG: hypothetical protein ACRDUV_17775 [Pseudonocardiaceae bacterium]
MTQTHTHTHDDPSTMDAASLVAVPDLPGWVWNALLDDLHERAVSLYQSGNRGPADALAEWIAVLDRHAGNLFAPCVHIVCIGKGRCLFARPGEPA